MTDRVITLPRLFRLVPGPIRISTGKLEIYGAKIRLVRCKS